MNPRYPFGVYAISNRARSATTRLLHKICLRAQLAYNTTYAIFCQALFLLFLGLFEIVAKKYSPGKKIPGREILQQTDTGLFAGLNRFVIPDAGLNFADMGAAHHQHGKSGLADTAADGQGQFSTQQHLMEWQIPSVLTAGFLQLIGQGLFVHTDAHGGDLQGSAQDLVPEENIAV